MEVFYMLVTERFCSVWTRGSVTGGLWVDWMLFRDDRDETLCID